MTHRLGWRRRFGNAELPRLPRRVDIMAMPATHRRYTAAEVRAFPEDGNRYEVIRGELHVSPSPRPRHQMVVARVSRALWSYLGVLGRADTLFAGPADISWDDETLVQPDLLVVLPEEVSNDWSTFRSLLLAVEVLSPSSLRRDRVDKRRLYQEQHVATYWIVDHDAGVVEVWEPADERPLLVAETLTWRVTPDAPELRLDLRELFSNLPS